MSGQLTEWFPLQIPDVAYYLDQFLDGRVILKSISDDHRIQILFYDELYRVTKKEFASIPASFCCVDRLVFLKGDDTPYIAWIKEISGGVFDAYNPSCTHFSVIAADVVIDVISSRGEPEFFMHFESGK